MALSQKEIIEKLPFAFTEGEDGILSGEHDVHFFSTFADHLVLTVNVDLYGALRLYMRITKLPKCWIFFASFQLVESITQENFDKEYLGLKIVGKNAQHEAIYCIINRDFGITL